MCVTDMAKLVIKSDNITPFGGLYSIFNRFSASGLRETIDSHLRRQFAQEFWLTDIFSCPIWTAVWQYRPCSPLTQIKRAAGPILPDIPVKWNGHLHPTLCKIGFPGGVIAQGPLNFGRPCAVTWVRRPFLHKVATAAAFQCGTRQAHVLSA